MSMCKHLTRFGRHHWLILKFCLKGGWLNFQYFDHRFNFYWDLWGKVFQKSLTWKFFRLEIVLRFGVPDNQILPHFNVPDNQILLHFNVPENQVLLHFGVPDNQILLHLDVPDNCSGLLLRGEAKQEPGKRFHSSNWGTLGLPPQNEEHFFTVHCTVYSVQCTVYTVYCTLYTVHCTLRYGVV